MITTGPPKIVGYFTQRVQVDGTIDVLKPKWKYPNNEKIRRINNGVPLLYQKQLVLPARYSVTAEALLRFLNDRALLQPKRFEYNVVCRASCLYHMLYREGEEDKKQEFKMKQTASGAIILEENVIVTEPKPIKSIGQWVEDILTKSTSSQKLQLYVVVQHIFYQNGRVINLFISKEIDSVLPSISDVKTSLDWKVCNYYMFNTKTSFLHYNVKSLIMDYLASGVTYIYGLRNTKDKVERVTVMENISRICESAELAHFKKLIGPLLFRICSINLMNTMITRNQHSVFWINGKRRRPTLSHVVQYPAQDLDHVKYDPDYHVLVVLGKYYQPIHYYHKYCFTDFITLDSIINKKYDGILKDPTKVILYGTREDLEKAKRVISLRIELIEETKPPVVIISIFRQFTNYFFDKYHYWFKKFNQE